MSEENKPAPVVDEDIAALVDPDTLDPSMHYRFVHERPQRIARVKAQGYQPVRGGEEDGVQTLVEGIIGADGIIRSGDCILMACPIERFQARRDRVNTLNRSRMAAPKAQFRKKASDSRDSAGKPVRVLTEDSLDKE